MSNKGKILVIGGAGYIGSHVSLSFLDRGYQVTVFDNLSTGIRENVPLAADFVFGDIENSADLSKVLESENEFAGVVHLAALKAAGNSMKEPGLYAKSNISATINLLDAISKSKIKHFIFSSSAAVYGDPTYLPVDEDHPTKPNNFYGFTKLAIEDLLKWFEQLKGIHSTNLRYFNAAGYDKDGRIGGVEHTTENLIPLVMEVAVGKREKLMIFGDDYDTPDGTCVRDYVHVTDIALAHVLAFERSQKTGESLNVNLGVGRGYSVFEVLQAARESSGHVIPTELVAKRSGDSPTTYAKVNFAEEKLGWKATHSSLKEIVETMWNQYRRVCLTDKTK
ncbi:MAG: UDP-glucose 4-epimerase GalE [SAR324 cluster bacterium]|nr:UDP-glucose 4-epimerase GalE [SAR324 cluster bacterium]